MRFRTILLLGAGGVIALSIIVAVAIALTPGQTNPAFATAVTFVEAAGKGDDATALAQLDNTLRTYVADHCPNGSVSACVQSYTPPDWGQMIGATFRRAAPDGANWDVEVISNYAAGTGASGVCIYTRVQPNGAGGWQVSRWAGWLHCSDPGARNMATNPATPNRAP